MSAKSNDQGRAYMDDIHHIIRYNRTDFPYSIIREETQKYPIDHIISVVALENLLINEEGYYVSDEAQWLDEQITYYVDTPEDLLLPSKQILHQIYD